MSRRTQEQVHSTLRGLMPLLSAGASSIEPLARLATNLLLQSQSRAPSLKPDEEPARCHAVCELACNRLKTRLDLPKIESRPPCAPRTYKKLYQYLERTLQDASVVMENDESVNEASVGRGRANIGRIVTPRKAGVQRSQTGTPRSVELGIRGKVLSPIDKDLRDTREIGITTPSAKKRKNVEPELLEEDVVSRTEEETPSRSAKRVVTRGRNASPQVIERTAPVEDFEADSIDEHVDAGEPAPDAVPLRHAGLGSLMENKFDWLSEERQAAYVRWEAKMFRRIEAIERQASMSRAAV